MSGPTSRLEAMFFGAVALIAFAGAGVVIWRACTACQAWWGS